MTVNWDRAISPGEDVIEMLAHKAIESLPAPYRDAARRVTLRVEDFADDDMLDDLGIENPFELTGLYDGVPLTRKSVMDQLDRPDTIWLFRRPILDEWAERDGTALGELVGHVLVHELAHHFGWSDEDIARIDPWWE